jgi:T5SS/PEP-CTERM-associated repeat protein
VDNGFYGFIGYNASASNNSVLVTGPGSFWNNRSDLKLGSIGSGNQMTIADGGSVRVAGTTYLGYDASASNNSALVTGSGSTWTNTGNLNVGFGGFGNSLTIAAGGAVFNVNGTLGGASSNAVTVTGTGSVWHNSGTLTLANGTLTLAQGQAFANQYMQNAGGTLAFQLGGTPVNGVLRVGGTAQLGGALNVTSLSGFQPALSNAFTLVTAASVSGTFATTSLPALGDALAWSVTYAPTSVVLRVVSGTSAYDLWAQAHIADPGQRGSDQNADGDSFSNWQEYVADTDPTNSASYFHVTAVSNLPPWTVCFLSSTGRLYTLNGISNLVNGVWTNVPGAGSRLGVGGLDAMQDTNVPPKGPFYRMNVELP